MSRIHQHTRIHWIGTALPALLLLVLLCAVACNKIPPPPEAVSLADAPAFLAKAFSNSKPNSEARTLVGQVIAALQAKNFVEASALLRQLCAIPELTENERVAATRCQLAANQELQAAETKVDEQAAPAAQALKTYKLLK